MHNRKYRQEAFGITPCSYFALAKVALAQRVKQPVSYLRGTVRTMFAL